MPKRTTLILMMGLLLPMLHGAGASPPPAKEPTIENYILRGTLDKAAGTLDVWHGDEFAFQLQLGPIENVTYAAEDNTQIVLELPSGDFLDIGTLQEQQGFRVSPDQPAFRIRQTLANRGTEPRPLEDEQLPRILFPKAEGLNLLGCDGLTESDVDRASYCFLAGANPDNQKGWVAGFLTHRRGSGVVFSKSSADSIAVTGTAQYGGRLLAPGASVAGETFFVGAFDDALNGLEAYANAIAAENGIRLGRSLTTGYCTWYSNPHGGACDERHVAKLVDFCAEHLKDYGFEVIQIDDKWQHGRSRPKTHSGPRLGFYEAHPKGPYPSGMSATAHDILASNLTPGLWFIPFAADPENPFAREHPEWFVQTPEGNPYYTYWAGWSLDMTHPGARAYVFEQAHHITREWRYRYIKVDGLWSGMATKILYPTPDYRDDGLGEARFHDSGATNLSAYREGLSLLRNAVGRDTFILGCNIAQNMRTLGASFGLVDGMRVGRDIGPQWDHIVPCAEMGSRLYFLNGRVWYNDPDCLVLREPLTLDQARAWASWIAVSDQMNLVSEWLPELPEERLDILKRSIPNHGCRVRPIDLFENNPPRVWHLPDHRRDGRHLVALFNWSEEGPQEVSVPLRALGLDSGGRWISFEYWANEFLSPVDGAITRTLRPSSCQVIAICPADDRPRVVSTSRHICQGAIDLNLEQWSPAESLLKSDSVVIGNDPYEVRIFIPKGCGSLAQVSVAPGDREGGVQTRVVNPGPEARFVITSPVTRRVIWKAKLK